MLRAPVTPAMLTWARQRSKRDPDRFYTKFRKLQEWEAGELQPTLRQAEEFARFAYVPFGYLFMDTPPVEDLPIPDFRTIEGRPLERPSPNLLDTIRICRDRQLWYHDHARREHEPVRTFVASVTVDDRPEWVAAEIGEALGFDVESRRDCRTWTRSLSRFIGNAERVGVLVMVNGVVQHNRRPLDPKEFRGFTLSDPLAPLVFINGKDSKAAQMFTLAHELGHLWLGGSALSNTGLRPQEGLRREEVWCNAVAAELLVPRETLESELLKGEPPPIAVPRLAKVFKVSTLVILRRLLDHGWIDRSEFDDSWQEQIKRLRSVNANSGGDYYRTTLARAGRRFTTAVLTSTIAGNTLYREAFRLLGIRKTATFGELCRRVGLSE